MRTVYGSDMARYRDLFDSSITDPAAFWADAATEVTWTRAPQRILDDSRPPFYRWFPDGQLNTCVNALDRHVAGGRGEQAALIYDSAVTDTKRTYTYGAHAAHVAIDARTGHVAVLDYMAVEDIGRAINPALVHGQSLGAVVQGLGGVFLDHLLYDADAQLLNASLADYLLPTATDFPNVRGVTMQVCLSPSNPLGAKGAGEGGIVAVAASTANAVAAALASLGVEPNELPLTPPRIWRLIQQAKLTVSEPTSSVE